ncbi:SDR family NAD(P)-dependent oxidoreductase [Sphingomonas radiodurans]|uniref:SDR family NAD(P)-dependent oxidoreductase n=1 Tax=Sphingomonas radiodurans TaxID=2890321 RepID=UPI001E34D9E9|nr:SDR family oxidoreductase [Sphingomonas radiodurans]WBH17755.1 SDR family NAD(P)-dependent oxidoreductase [Sphingomonas radiodurans]
MDLGLKGLKVVLTGGSRGTGRATLELFAAEGADVGFFSRNQEQIDEAAAAYAKHGGKVVARQGDLNDLERYPALLAEIADELGGCDIFIPSASASGSKLAQDWDACYKMDVLGTVRGCEAMAPYLERSSHAAVVILASIAATETFFAPNAFNAIKAALITYSGQLSQAWGPKGIRVNAVSPGPVWFEGGNWDDIKQGAPDMYKSFEETTALKRLGRTEDVARAIAFLASPAADWITGTNLVVDGGYTKRVQF